MSYPFTNLQPHRISWNENQIPDKDKDDESVDDVMQFLIGKRHWKGTRRVILFHPSHRGNNKEEDC